MKKKLMLGMGIVIVVILLALIGMYVIEHDVGGIYSFYKNSYLYVRINSHNAWDITSDGRISIKFSYLKHMGESMWGGNYLKNRIVKNYAHELWLDIYDEVGIIPYIFIIIYTLSAVLRLIKTIKNKNLEYPYKVALWGYVLIMLAQFFIEPILQGAPILLYSFMLIDGITAAFCRNTGRGVYE